MHLFIYLKKKMTTFPRYYISIMNNHSREIRYRCKKKKERKKERKIIEYVKNEFVFISILEIITINLERFSLVIKFTRIFNTTLHYRPWFD